MKKYCFIMILLFSSAAGFGQTLEDINKLENANKHSETEYYGKQNDDANLTAILKKGRSLYPQNDHWVDVEIDNNNGQV